MQYVKLNGVSPMLDLEVDQYGHSTMSNSSTQAPLDLIKHFLRPLTMMLFDTSVWPLAWGVILS